VAEVEGRPLLESEWIEAARRGDASAFDIDPEIFEKLIDTGVTATATHVHGSSAWWVAGGDHFFVYVDADGQVVNTTLRLAGPTLIWEEAGMTHRVEGAPSLADALRVAESLE
jgi:hypothetical protein